MIEADLLDIIFKITVSGGGFVVAGVAVRIALSWGRMESKVNALIDAFAQSLEERKQLVDKNDRAHNESRARIDTLDREVAKIKGYMGINGK